MSETPTEAAQQARLHERLERPEPPIDGSPEGLLTHAVAFGGYVNNLETQLIRWHLWAKTYEQ